MERTFFKLAHFCFCLQFKLCSKFLRISKIRLYSNLCRCRFFKIHRPQKSGISKIYLHCRPNFWTPRFLRFVNFENLHLHKFEYNRIFDIRRNFEQSLNWRKKTKMCELEKSTLHSLFLGGSGVRYLHFFGGTAFFKEGSQNFRFYKKTES